MIRELYPIDGFSQESIQNFLEYMRTIRNEISCRNNMTNFREEITPEMQRDWYKSLSKNVSIYMYLAIEHGTIVYPCGYGLITTNNDESILTGVIEKQYRGKGYGKDLFSKLVNIAKTKSKKVSLEVLDTNYPAKKIYESLGFVSKKIDNNIISMELLNDTSV